MRENCGCEVSVFGVSDERTQEDLPQSGCRFSPGRFPLCGSEILRFCSGNDPGQSKLQQPDVIELHGHVEIHLAGSA